MQQLNYKVSSTERKLTGGDKVRNYHAPLSSMLQGLRNVQSGIDGHLCDVENREVRRVDVIRPI